MKKEMLEKSHAIIHSAASSAAAISGFSAQIPCADNVALSAIELGMVIALGEVFGIELSKSAATGIVTGQMGTVFGRCASQVLTGWLPIVGNVINAATAAALVESLGWYAVDSFAKKSGISVS